MKRQDRYPDTESFHYYNANPKNRITSDCVVRALTAATKIPYNEVVLELAKIQCSTGYDCSENRVIDKFLTSHGFVKNHQPRKFDNTKYTGKEFCRSIQGLDETIVANIGGNHLVAILDDKIHDIWDSSDGCIGIYWSKI